MKYQGAATAVGTVGTVNVTFFGKMTHIMWNDISDSNIYNDKFPMTL